MFFYLYELAVDRRDELFFGKGINFSLKIEKDTFCHINLKHGENGLLNSSFLRIGMIQKREDWIYSERGKSIGVEKIHGEHIKKLVN